MFLKDLTSGIIRYWKSIGPRIVVRTGLPLCIFRNKNKDTTAALKPALCFFRQKPLFRKKLAAFFYLNRLSLWINFQEDIEWSWKELKDCLRDSKKKMLKSSSGIPEEPSGYLRISFIRAIWSIFWCGMSRARVHAADGYARATGKVGVCLVTSRSGSHQYVTGMLARRTWIQFSGGFTGQSTHEYYR